MALTLCDHSKPTELDLLDAELIRQTLNHIKILSTQRLNDLKRPKDLENIMGESIKEFYRGVCLNRRIAS